MQVYASKGVEVRVASLNLDAGATCKVSDGAATGAAKKKRFKTCWIWARESGILGVMDGGVHIGDEEGTRASKEHPKSLTPSQSLERLEPDFLRPMLELRISGACKAALPEGSSAVTPSVPKAVMSFLDGWKLFIEPGLSVRWSGSRKSMFVDFCKVFQT